MLPTSLQTPDCLEPEGWRCWLPVTSPLTNQKNVHGPICALQPSPSWPRILLGFPRCLVVKNPPANAEVAGGADSIPGSGRSPGGGNGNPLQCFGWDNSMDRGIWWATVHRVTKSQAWLKNWTSMQDVIYSPWRGMRSPWLCLMANYYYFVLFDCFPLFLHFLTLIKLSFGTQGRPEGLRFFYKQEVGRGHWKGHGVRGSSPLLSPGKATQATAWWQLCFSLYMML